eukprot:CAMPEP_0204198396 /NCGR_PEP_ID=MMETSP0361-20130328/65253_1 /ASSEMBLY_ACC=CAM_ASM_000343 /TAXON_ID=268821 /ORGANISM="Scrippsiella Hangoei, Strain SHTV-5" /LENGTH=65 /DNA_ID=CAMNT_0051160505 /DNA_START=15 /DNA_END=209 /DNA_ORIENTATION=+
MDQAMLWGSLTHWWGPGAAHHSWLRVAFAPLASVRHRAFDIVAETRLCCFCELGCHEALALERWR